MGLTKALNRKLTSCIEYRFILDIFCLYRIISEPRLQNPYMLYNNTNSHISPYDFSTNEYQQRKLSGNFRDMLIKMFI